YREVVGGALDALVRQRLPEASFNSKQTTSHDGYRQTLGLVRYRSVEGHQAELPVVMLTPKKSAERTIIWLDGEGKSGLFDKEGALRKPIRALLEGGATVIGVDLLYQGEFLADGKPVTRGRWLAGEEAFAGWTYCCNLPTFTKRVHDILAVAAWARHQDPRPKEVDLVAVGGAGPWAAVALAQERTAFNRAAIDTGGFRFARLTDVY